MNFLRLTSESSVFEMKKRDGGILLTWNKSHDFYCATRIGVCSIFLNNVTPDSKARLFKIQSNLTQPGPFNPTNELCTLLVNSGSSSAYSINERG